MNGQGEGGVGHNEPKPPGFHEVKWIAKTLFTYVNPLLRAAARQQVDSEEHVDWMPPPSDSAQQLSHEFEQEYQSLKARAKQAGKQPRLGLTAMTLIRLNAPVFVLQTLWTLIEVAQRLGTPVVLRQFLRWLAKDRSAVAAGTPVPPQWQGWLLALALGACGFSMCIIHHQLFWLGMHSGFTMRQQAVAAVHAKLLRLNSAAVSAVSSGHVVNLVSNDVRRFDDAMPFWTFLFCAPLELAMVLLMVSLELDFVSALAGVATSLAIIPIQGFLVRYIGGLRRNTAQNTDERVRLTGEVIQGALAMKMLGWEAPLAASIQAIRGREAHFQRRMARIRACNMALQFCITPIVSFTTFAVFRARNGTLNVASVFYALSLLHLPKLYMVNFFVLAIQTMTELRVSLQRIDRFLTTPEPPAPMHLHADSASASASGPATSPASGKASAPSAHAVAKAGACEAWDVPQGPDANGHAGNGHVPNGAVEHVPNGGHVGDAPAPSSAGGRPAGSVALRGADYDWERPFGEAQPSLERSVHHADAFKAHAGKAPAAAASGGSVSVGPGPLPASKSMRFKGTGLLRLASVPRRLPSTPSGAAPHSNEPASPAGSEVPGGADHHHHDRGAACAGPTLQSVVLSLRPGELLGVCGEVGSGKSSLLAALLGELQPLQPQDPTAAAATASCDHGHGGDVMPPSKSGSEGAAASLGPVVVGTVAYCAQVPWIVAGSVRDNILFGRPYEEAWYARVVVACALSDDLAALAAGDATELGERGINLSGGQKARVALARAAYCRPAIGLLDDPLSAVDPRVGRVLFDQCLGPSGLMACPASAPDGAATRGSTRVLVTHQRQFLPQCDRVLVMRGGRVAALGTWAEVSAQSLPELTTGHAQLHTAGGAEGGDGETTPTAVVGLGDVTVDEIDDDLEGKGAAEAKAQAQQEGAAAAAEGAQAAEKASSAANDPAPDLQTRGSLPSTPSIAAAAGGKLRLSMSRSIALRAGSIFAFAAKPAKAPRGAAGALDDAKSDQGPSASGQSTNSTSAKGQLIQAEERATGSVSMRTYGSYCGHLGWLVTGGIGVSMVAGQAAFLAGEWWLALWSRAEPADQARPSWLWVYGLLTGLVIVLSLLRSVLWFEASVTAATSIHNTMVETVLRAPLAFYHTNPTGRIVNRFSKDLGQVDDLLPTTFFDALQCGGLVLGAFVLVSIAVPVILPVFVPLALIFYWVRARYIAASRDIKRFEAVTRSPVYATFGAALKGLPTIRAYNAAARFQAAFLALMTRNGAWYFAFISTARWIGVRLDAVSGSALAAACLLAMAMRHSVQPQLVGLALTHVLQLTGLMQWFVRQTAEVENNMTCVERMLDYTHLTSEPPRQDEGGGDPPPGWPRSGALEYAGVSAVYRPGLPPVLRGLSFKLAAGSSCGVVGRTGSGKSSLMLTLYRLITVTEGRIWLDGVDTSSIGLDCLRRALAIIPQDPVLFSGTLRSNLDPWGAHGDAALWRALERVQLRAALGAMKGGLDARMAEAGDNLSVGQRQLFCLARALLQDARVLALDEATANVDRATDALIQRALREFAHPTGAGAGAGTPKSAAPGSKAGSGVAGAHENGAAADDDSDAEDVDAAASREGRVLLVIAHRIDTILDCDKLLVLGAGQLLEFGSPAELAAAPGGTFARMVSAAKAAHRPQ